MSYKTRVTFTIKETAEGTPFLYMEALDHIPNFPSNPPAFYLPVGTDMAKAEEIARYLNQNIEMFCPEPLSPVASFQTEVK
ncbi:hypothetical protein ACIP1G_11135 [Pseudomonas sp. NPDC089392]|uniref:hypothetical protein n=1 Tax=Pseudomonas sp. NPDC089392 TaxID=3364459 RepID=UPI0037F3E2E7